MKKQLICIILVFFNTILLAQMPLWTVGTAKTIPKRQGEISIFEPARYGLSKSLEVLVHPLAFFVLPEFDIKKMWINYTVPKEKKFLPNRKIMFSTVHGLSYPSIVLNFAKKTGAFNLLPQDSVIPGIFTLKNELILSIILTPRTSCDAENNMLTIKLGHKMAFKTGNITAPPIDRPVLYKETAIYHDKMLWYAALGLDAHLTESVNYSVDLYFYSINLPTEKYAFEHKGMLMWNFSQNLRGLIGYKLIFGSYPSGSKFNILPLFDLTWTFNLKRGKQLDLFDDEDFKPFDDRDNK